MKFKNKFYRGFDMMKDNSKKGLFLFISKIKNKFNIKSWKSPYTHPFSEWLNNFKINKELNKKTLPLQQELIRSYRNKTKEEIKKEIENL